MNLEQDLAIIARQETALCCDAFDENAAWELGGRLREAALLRKACLAIDITIGGRSVFSCALAGTSPNNAEWLRRKRNVVLHFHRSSFGLGLQLEREGTTLAAKFALPPADYAAAGGGFPLRLRNAGVIGAVVVSGLPQREDHKFVVSVLAGYLNVSLEGMALE